MSAYANYNDVIEQLTASGLQIDQIEIDSPKPKRCMTADGSRKEKRGWYWLSSFTVDNESLIIGAYGIYVGNDNGKQTIKLSKEKRDRLTPEQLSAQKARQKDAQKRAEAQRKKEADAAAARALANWKRAPLEGDSDYLQRKQIEAHGIRFDRQGALVIPMTDSGDNIRGLQLIYPANHPRAEKAGRNKEFWPAGIQMQGTFYLIGNPGKVLLVAEGYATAASLHQATGHAVAVVWSANNILPACQELHKKYRRSRLLICADDDNIQKCTACSSYTPIKTDTCLHCSQPHRKQNAGISNAQAAAITVNGAWIAPKFKAELPTDRKGPTDFNDLHTAEGLEAVAAQIDGELARLSWLKKPVTAETTVGAGERTELKSILSIDESVERFAFVYGGKSTMFDKQEHILVPKADVLDILPEHGWRDFKPLKKVVRLDEVGFDPSGTDSRIRCNLWGGWPTVPKAGKCDALLELLEYLCSNEESPAEAYQWVINWLAYPVQHPGAKMKTALIFHGPQGTGKNLFFESIMAIYGEYGRIVDQSAIEDKFNDWASKKLFLIADEVVARTELFHIKNKLKCLVTGEWIRINPKNVAAHDERNHVNLVFLSNESQPLVLEKDDRRYCVIHTPAKLPETFYHSISDELKAGGIAALHHHLLHLQLADFNEHTKPPVTKAKNNLIEVSMDSVNTFIGDWIKGEIPDVTCCPCLGTHLFSVYRKYCEKFGIRGARDKQKFISSIKMMEGWKAGESVMTFDLPGSSVRVGRRMVIPPQDNISEQHKKTEGETQTQWLTDCFFAFARSTGQET